MWLQWPGMGRHDQDWGSRGWCGRGREGDVSLKSSPPTLRLHSGRGRDKVALW
jgi:hypothetical protein